MTGLYIEMALPAGCDFIYSMGPLAMASAVYSLTNGWILVNSI